MFTPLDLIAPIGICGLSFGLCLLVALKFAKKISAKAVCILTGVAFLSGIPVWYYHRAKALSFDYESGHGLRVKQGKKNKCEKAYIEKYTNETIDFWSKHYEREKILPILTEGWVACLDQKELGTIGRWVAAYKRNKAMVLGYDPANKERTGSLLIHELSHLIHDGLDISSGNETAQHEIFKEKKLGH